MEHLEGTTERTYGGETLQVRRAKRRALLLEAGLEVFGTRGFRGATIRGICREAGLTDRYFYESFGSADDLLAAVFDTTMTEVRAAVVAAVLPHAANTTPEDAFRAGLDAYFRAIEDARIVRICWMEVLGAGPPLDRLYHDSVSRFAELVTGLAAEITPGWLPGDPELAAAVAVGVVGGISQLSLSWLLSGYATPRATIVEAALRLILGQGTFAGG